MVAIPETLSVALNHHQAGRLQEAERLYQQILLVDTRNADALHLLGALYHQAGNLELASRYLEEAIHVNPNVGSFYNSLGNLRCDQRRLEDGVSAYQKAVELDRRSDEFWLNLGSGYYDLARLEEALDCFKQSIRLNRDFPEAYNNLANVLKDLNRQDEAVLNYKRAIRLNKHYGDAYFNLGNLYREQSKTELDPTQKDRFLDQAEACYRNASTANFPASGAWVNLGMVLNLQERYEDALQIYQQALQQDSGNRVELYNNLGNTLQNLERWSEALSCYQNAIALKPDFEEAYTSLGNLYRKIGKLSEATTCYRQLIRISPESGYAHFNLGNFLFLQDHLDEAIEHFKTALIYQPNSLEIYNMLGIAYTRTNQTKEALDCYLKAYKSNPTDGFLVKQAMVLPSIYQSQEDLNFWRARLETEVQKLQTKTLDISNPVFEVGATNFYLAYHGQNDLDIQVHFAKLFQNIPKFHYPENRPQNEKIKIGFISRLFRQKHTIGKINQGIITHLDREQFSVVLFALDDHNNRSDPMAIEPEDRYIWLPEENFEKAAQFILTENLDILFYLDIGMDPFTYFLAFSRLAPVQCVTWGHPVTTGIPTMDYYISWKGAEGDDPQSRYSEKIILLENPTTYFYHPSLGPNPRSKESLGFDPDPDTHLYVCAQSLFKLHPEFDEVMAEILRRDPKGKLYFLHFKYPHMGATLKERWKKYLPDVCDRMIISPRLNDQDFLAFQAYADVLLDPYHFGAGITNLEGFAFGTPVVTWPREHLRGRFAYAYYQQMGIHDCIASSSEEYIDIALRLGTDPIYRQSIREKILSSKDILFENPAIIKELEQFFQDSFSEATS